MTTLEMVILDLRREVAALKARVAALEARRAKPAPRMREPAPPAPPPAPLPAKTPTKVSAPPPASDTARERIVAYITAHPWCYRRDLFDAVNGTPHNMKMRLLALVKDGTVQRIGTLGSFRYALAGVPLPAGPAPSAPRTRGTVAEAVAAHLAAHPGQTQTQVAQALGVTAKVVSSALWALERRGRVEKSGTRGSRSAPGYRYRLTPPA